MSKRKCQRCERDQTDTATICHACTRDLKHALARTASLWPHLEEAIGKHTTMGPRASNKPTKASEQPLPVNLHASQVADHAKAVLAGWCRALSEDNRLTPPPDTVPAMCGWLQGHMGTLRRHEAAAEACDEITHMTGRVSRTVDLPEEKTRIFVGPCVTTDEDGDPCPGEIHAIIPAQGATGSPRMECRECRNTWPAIQWARTGDLIRRRAKQIETQKHYRRALP